MLRGEGQRQNDGLGAAYFDALNIDCGILDEFRPIVEDDVPDADIVVATWWKTAHWVAALSPSKGQKVYLMQDYGAEAGGQPFEEVKRTWELPLHIVTISPWLRNLILEHRDMDVTLVPNAVDHEQFATPLRSKPETPTVGFVYSSMPQKGTDICVEAIAIARQSIPSLQVVAFGLELCQCHNG